MIHAGVGRQGNVRTPVSIKIPKRLIAHPSNLILVAKSLTWQVRKNAIFPTKHRNICFGIGFWGIGLSFKGDEQNLIDTVIVRIFGVNLRDRECG
jgi:hypothetical protein